jgi:hypothetical protein
VRWVQAATERAPAAQQRFWESPCYRSFRLLSSAVGVASEAPLGAIWERSVEVAETMVCPMEAKANAAIAAATATEHSVEKLV